MSAHRTAVLSFALLLVAGAASAQYGYSVQGPPPAGMGVGNAPPPGTGYAPAGPSMDPNMGMAPTSYGGPAYTGQQNYPPQQAVAPQMPTTPLLSYGQLEVDYLYTTYKDPGLHASNGASVSLMAKLFDPFFLHFAVDLGNGSTNSFSSKNYSFSTVHLGGGGYIALSDRVHLTGEVGLLYAHLDTGSGNSVGFSDGAVYMMPGIRFAATDSLELDGHLTATSSDKYDSFIFDVGGYYKLFSQMDVGLDVGFGDQSTTYKAGIRFRW
jgi:hypothetical protein